MVAAASSAASSVVGFPGLPSVSGELDAELVFELKASPGQACVPSAAGVLKRELHRSVGIGTPRVEAGTGVGSGCVTESGCILDPGRVPESANPGRVTDPVLAQDSVPASESVSDPGRVTESRCIFDSECVPESANPGRVTDPVPAQASVNRHAFGA